VSMLSLHIESTDSRIPSKLLSFKCNKIKEQEHVFRHEICTGLWYLKVNVGWTELNLVPLEIS